MAKKITEMGYKATAVVCGKFFDLDNVLTFEELAEKYGYDNDEEDNKALVETFTCAGYEYLGCVAVKEELDEAVSDACGLMGGYLLKDTKNGRLYVANDVWDEARYMGKTRAYRFNVFTSGSMDYRAANEAYNEVMAQK